MPSSDYFAMVDQADEKLSEFRAVTLIDPHGAVIKVADQEGQILEIIVEAFEGKIRLVVWDNRHDTQGSGPQIDQIIHPLSVSREEYALTITTEYGGSSGVYPTQEARWEALVKYAKGWWDEDGPDRTPPEDENQLVEEYFDFSGETYTFSLLDRGES